MSNIDILITNDDLTLDVAKEPQLVEGRASIAQDIKHMIRETGFVVQMVAERSTDKRAHFMKLIEIAVEEDTRIEPGTARVTETASGLIAVTANTVEFGETNA